MFGGNFIEVIFCELIGNKIRLNRNVFLNKIDQFSNEKNGNKDK